MPLQSRFLTLAASAASVTLIVQGLAFGRQLLVAVYYGVGRGIDSYVLLYTIATIAVFTLAGIFDSIAVPHLVRARERDGDAAAVALAGSIFRLSLIIGLIMSVLYLTAVVVLTPLIAAGFGPDERRGLYKLAWYFLPWTLVCVPYYAAASRYKMQWRFHRVFAAEIVVVAVSIAILFLWHGDIANLPLAYAGGYFIGVLSLVTEIPILPRRLVADKGALRTMWRNCAEMFVTNQTISLSSLVDRHMQSFLPQGGIGAVNYSSQIIASLSSLLTLREIYMVPLARSEERGLRLERLLSGLLLLSVPLAGLVASFAPDLVSVLFKHGRFDEAATVMTARVLRISALGLITSVLFLPIFRMFQILDRILLTQLFFLLTVVEFAGFGYLFVLVWKLGVEGVALMQVAGSIPNVILAVAVLNRCGAGVRWKVLSGWLMLAVAATVTAWLVAHALVANLEMPLIRLGLGGAVYGVVVLLCYLCARRQIQDLVSGTMRVHQS